MRSAQYQGQDQRSREDGADGLPEPDGVALGQGHVARDAARDGTAAFEPAQEPHGIVETVLPPGCDGRQDRVVEPAGISGRWREGGSGRANRGRWKASCSPNGQVPANRR